MKLIITTDDTQKLYAFLDQQQHDAYDDAITPFDYVRTEGGCSISFKLEEAERFMFMAEDNPCGYDQFECEEGEGLYEAAQLALVGWHASGDYESPYRGTHQAVERLIESFKHPTS